MRNDHYAVLGVPPSASQAAILAAYRELARLWHPDLNPDKHAAAQFARVSEAYAVLGREGRRAAYDRMVQVSPAARTPSRPARAICCTECGAVTAQPRILVFRYTVGLGVWSRIHRTEGVFCSRCARRSALRASLVTALAGWWAIPFGPFLTAWCIWSNARGGSRAPKADRRLALVNAEIFLELRNLNLAHALARHALGGAEGADAARARDIIRQAVSQGGDDRRITLKDPWRTDMLAVGLHALLLLALPASLVVTLAIFSAG